MSNDVIQRPRSGEVPHERRVRQSRRKILKNFCENKECNGLIYDKEYIALLTNAVNEYASRIARMEEAAKVIFRRHKMQSGSLEMAECDELCKKAGLEVWEWKS